MVIFSYIIRNSLLLFFFIISQNICLSKYIFVSSLLSLPPFSLPFLSFHSYLFLLRPRVVPAGVTKPKPFRTKWSRSAKTRAKLPLYLPRSKPFAQNDGRSGKTALKLRFYLCPRLSHEMSVDRQTLNVCRRNPFARNERQWAIPGRSAKAEVKMRFYLSLSNPFARNEGQSAKTETKLRFYLPPSNPSFPAKEVCV